jgi:signal transduction histidine kinase
MASHAGPPLVERVLTPDAEQLLALARFNVAAGAPIVFAAWCVWRTPGLLTMVGLTVGTFVLGRICVHYAKRNEVGRGILALVAGIWLPTLGLAVLGPEFWAVTVVFAVFSVLMAVPFVAARDVLGLIGVASGILLVGGWFRANPWLHMLPSHTSPVVLGILVAVSSGFGAILCMFSVWQSHSRLVTMVTALRQSERELEQKVAERTAGLVESQRKLAQARDEAMAANQHKSAFLANMSHELRTPLNAVIGFSEMLSEKVFGDLNEKQEEYVADIHNSGKHLLSLINDILDLSKIEAGKLELALSTFPLEEAIDGALVLTRERAYQHGLTQVREIEPGLGPIEADERKVKQILVNLLSNAVKFTDAGGRVTLRARRLGDEVEIAVADTGIGIAPEEQALVFEEFRQVGEDHGRRAEGTGLGLALVRRLVELHGGRVHLESEPGRGSCFTVTLPARVPAALRGAEPA